MRYSFRSNQKIKGVHVTTILIVVFFLFLSYVGIFWGIGWFKSAKAQELMTKVILNHAESVDDAKLVELMVESLRAEAGIETAIADYTILRGEGGKGVSAKLVYKHKVSFPPTDWSFDLTFRPGVLEDLTKKGIR